MVSLAFNIISTMFDETLSWVDWNSGSITKGLQVGADYSCNRNDLNFDCNFDCYSTALIVFSKFHDSLGFQSPIWEGKKNQVCMTKKSNEWRKFASPIMNCLNSWLTAEIDSTLERKKIINLMKFFISWRNIHHHVKFIRFLIFSARVCSLNRFSPSFILLF